MSYDEMETGPLPPPSDISSGLLQCFSEIRGWCYHEMGCPWHTADAFAHWCVVEIPLPGLRYGQLRRLFALFEAGRDGAHAYRVAHEARLVGDGWVYPYPIRVS